MLRVANKTQRMTWLRTVTHARATFLPRASPREYSSSYSVAARDWQQHRREYETEGFTILRNVVDEHLVAEMRQHVDFLSTRFPSLPPEHWHHPILRNDAFWVRVVSDACMLACAKHVVSELEAGPGIALFSSHYFNKPPKTGKEVLWHQDGSYWPLEPMQVATLWLAVDPSRRENGCLKVLRGSHRESLRPITRDTRGNNVLGSTTHREEDIDPSLVVYLELEPGDVSIHNPNIVHASDPNTSDQRRCGLTVRYMPSTTRCLSESQPVMMMEGEAVASVNNYRSWPKYR